MTEDDWDKDDWDEGGAPPEAASSSLRAADRPAPRWRPFALGAFGGVLILAALALTGGGEAQGPERALSPEAAAAYAPAPGSLWPQQEAPKRLFGAEASRFLETGDIPRRPGTAVPPPPEPSGWDSMALAVDPPAPMRPRNAAQTPVSAAPPWADPGAEDLVFDRPEAAPPSIGLGGVSADIETHALEAAAPLPAPAPAMNGQGLNVDAAPLAADSAPSAPEAAPQPEAPPPAEAQAESQSRAEPWKVWPTPRAKPSAPSKIAAPAEASEGEAETSDPAEPVKADSAQEDPDVYSPPKPDRKAEPAPAAPSAPQEAAQDASPQEAPAPRASPARSGWGARLQLAEASAPVHDPAPAPAQGAAPPVHNPGKTPPSASRLTAVGPIYDPAPPPSAASPAAPPASAAPAADAPAAPRAKAAAPTASASTASASLASASVEFGPELSPEAFAELDVASAQGETRDLPKVRRAPIDSPEDGPFSFRSDPPAAPAPRRRAQPALPADAPRATVILTALGLHEAVTLRAMRDTPEAVALAFAPIGRRVETRVADLRAAGRVALVEAPMEAMSRAATPEDMTLATGVAATENQARLGRVLASAPQASGIATYLGARFTADSGALAGVMPVLAQRGLFVLENQPTNRSLLREEARRAGVRYAAAPTALDRDPSASAIRAALTQLERRALADGEAVGIMAVSNEALDALALWTEDLAARGVRLAPLGEALD